MLQFNKEKRSAKALGIKEVKDHFVMGLSHYYYFSLACKNKNNENTKYVCG